jgi:transposase
MTPINKFQRSIQKIFKESNLVIDKRQRQLLIQKKPSATILKAQLKLHKIYIPIRPVINNRTAPAYKLSKHLTEILQHINLNNQYNLNNSINLENDLINIPA